jgi:hypothetical protein
LLQKVPQRRELVAFDVEVVALTVIDIGAKPTLLDLTAQNSVSCIACFSALWRVL